MELRVVTLDYLSACSFVQFDIWLRFHAFDVVIMQLTFCEGRKSQ